MEPVVILFYFKKFLQVVQLLSSGHVIQSSVSHFYVHCKILLIFKTINILVYKVYIFRVSFYKSISCYYFLLFLCYFKLSFLSFLPRRTTSLALILLHNFLMKRDKFTILFCDQMSLNLEWKTQCDNSFVNVSIQLIMSLGFKIFFIFGYHILMLLHLLTFFLLM